MSFLVLEKCAYVKIAKTYKYTYRQQDRHPKNRQRGKRLELLERFRNVESYKKFKAEQENLIEHNISDIY